MPTYEYGDMFSAFDDRTGPKLLLATGKCCGGGDTTKPTKPVVRTKTMPYTSTSNFGVMGKPSCGCQNMPVKNEQDRKTCMKDCHSK